MQHSFREERESGAEEGARDEQGCECARGLVVVVVVLIVLLGVGLEAVAGECSAVFVHPVAGEDEGECGSGPREGLDV